MKATTEQVFNARKKMIEDWEGKRICYNKDHSATILKENDTHYLVRLDAGSVYAVKKNNFAKKDFI